MHNYKIFLFLTIVNVCLFAGIIRTQEEEVEHQEEAQQIADEPVAPVPPVQEAVPAQVPSKEQPEASQAAAEESAPIVVTATEPPVLISIAPVGEGLDTVRDRITSVLESSAPHDITALEQAKNIPPATLTDYGLWLAKQPDKEMPINGLELLNPEQLDALLNGLRTGLEEEQAATVSFTTRVLNALSTVSLVIGAFPIAPLILLFDMIVPLFTPATVGLASEEQVTQFNNSAASVTARLQDVINTTSSDYVRDQFIRLRDRVQSLSAQTQPVSAAPVEATGL